MVRLKCAHCIHITEARPTDQETYFFHSVHMKEQHPGVSIYGSAKPIAEPFPGTTRVEGSPAPEVMNPEREFQAQTWRLRPIMGREKISAIEYRIGQLNGEINRLEFTLMEKRTALYDAQRELETAKRQLQEMQMRAQKLNERRYGGVEQ